jgi:ankyrin repeat protein
LDNSGQTPLLYAVFRGDLEMVKLLLEGGADPNMPSDVGDTPLWHSSEHDFGLSKIEECLSQYGAE